MLLRLGWSVGSERMATYVGSWDKTTGVEKELSAGRSVWSTRDECRTIDETGQLDLEEQRDRHKSVLNLPVSLHRMPYGFAESPLGLGLVV